MFYEQAENAMPEFSLCQKRRTDIIMRTVSLAEQSLLTANVSLFNLGDTSRTRSESLT